jgi:hypothetical protein
MAKPNGTIQPQCPTPPYFDRLNYFYGQMLGANDFKAEQDYFREKIKLHNRCLHGYGTVCGLLVVPADAHVGCVPDPEKPEVVILPGLALDAEGNELVVRDGDPVLKIDLWKALSPADQAAITGLLDQDDDCELPPLFVCLKFCQCGFATSRPIVADPCSRSLPQEYGEIREGVEVTVSLKPPPDDHRCETCCAGPCPCAGLLLARVDRFHPEKAVAPHQIHDGLRRRIGTYPFTTITGVNWRHGSDAYNRYETGELLKHGVIVHFSRPVLSETLRRGVIDVYQVESRSTRHPNIIELRGEIEHSHHPTTRRLRYRLPHLEECPEPGDRIVIVVRGAFILDECCRPVDGLNVGGRVPYVDDEGRPWPDDRHPALHGEHCPTPPWGYGPWASGNGTGGGTFEGWFYVEEGRK